MKLINFSISFSLTFSNSVLYTLFEIQSLYYWSLLLDRNKITSVCFNIHVLLVFLWSLIEIEILFYHCIAKTSRCRLSIFLVIILLDFLCEKMISKTRLLLSRRNKWNLSFRWVCRKIDFSIEISITLDISIIIVGWFYGRIHNIWICTWICWTNWWKIS